MNVELVVVGTSMGGLNALEALLSALPSDFAPPIAVVQHRSPGSPGLLAALLRRRCALPISEPQDKEAIQPGRVYLAPADYHLLVEDATFALTTDSVVSYARPSIDVLFETAAEAYNEGVVGIVMTGANSDGANGAARIKAYGGCVIVQEPETAECAVMPRAALAFADCVLPLKEIGPFLVRMCRREAVNAYAE